MQKIIHGDLTTARVISRLHELAPAGGYPLMVADPPYGNIVNEYWDQIELSQGEFTEWMLGWARDYYPLLAENGVFYIWGGTGIPMFRPFMEFCARVEFETPYKIYNLITWKKKRAYGVQHNYLFTREELIVLFKGENIKKPRCFNIPLLDEKRGYAGFNEKYPAKSEHKRRSNVWMDEDTWHTLPRDLDPKLIRSNVWDETEILRGKLHECHKAAAVAKIPIEVHTNPKEVVLDLFSGSGETSFQAKLLNRGFVAVEKDPHTYQLLTERLK